MALLQKESARRTVDSVSGYVDSFGRIQNKRHMLKASLTNIVSANWLVRICNIKLFKETCKFKEIKAIEIVWDWSLQNWAPSSFIVELLLVAFRVSAQHSLEATHTVSPLVWFPWYLLSWSGTPCVSLSVLLYNPVSYPLSKLRNPSLPYDSIRVLFYDPESYSLVPTQ